MPPICARCEERLELIEWPVCPRCAAPVPSTGSVDLSCSHCRGDKLRFDRSLTLGSYEGLLRQLVMRTKADRQGVVTHALADLAWRRLGRQLRELQIDVVTAVPMLGMLRRKAEHRIVDTALKSLKRRVEGLPE